MSEAFAFAPEDFAPRGEEEDALIVDIDGYEGPLDLLLALARRQKVDLMKLSVTRLVDQYLEFVRAAGGRRLNLAADYLVMAAWLTLLKSRLLLPASEAAAEAEPSAEAMARTLAFRLAKLHAMRAASEALSRHPILGRDVFVRGDPDAVHIVSKRKLVGDLHALIGAYVTGRRRSADAGYRPPPVRAYPLEAARDRLSRLLPELARWTALARLAPASGGPQEDGTAYAPRASCLASTLSAGLELVRDGALDMRQLAPFEDVWLRRRRLAA